MLPELHRLDFKLIYSFIAIVECQGVTAAQARLHLTPSVISGHLKQIEEQLGMVLCQRGRAGFALTADGRAVYEMCLTLQEAVTDFQKSVQQIRQLQPTRGGSIQLSIADNLPNRFLARLRGVIAHSYQSNNHIHFNINIQSPERMLESLSNGQCDIGLGYFYHFPELLSFRPAFVETQVLCCGRQHPLYTQDSLDFDTLKEQQQWVKRGYAVGVFAGDIPANNYTATAYHMDATAQIILAGHHIGYLPEDMAMQHVDAGQMRILLANTANYSVQHHWAYKGSMTPLTEWFYEKMQSQYELGRELAKIE